ILKDLHDYTTIIFTLISVCHARLSQIAVRSSFPTSPKPYSSSKVSRLTPLPPITLLRMGKPSATIRSWKLTLEFGSPTIKMIGAIGFAAHRHATTISFTRPPNRLHFILLTGITRMTVTTHDEKAL